MQSSKARIHDGTSNTTPFMYVYICVCVRVFVPDSLSEALNAISVSTELTEEELKPHLDIVLAALLEKSKSSNIYHFFNTFKHLNF